MRRTALVWWRRSPASNRPLERSRAGSFELTGAGCDGFPSRHGSRDGLEVCALRRARVEAVARSITTTSDRLKTRLPLRPSTQVRSCHWRAPLPKMPAHPDRSHCECSRLRAVSHCSKRHSQRKRKSYARCRSCHRRCKAPARRRDQATRGAHRSRSRDPDFNACIRRGRRFRAASSKDPAIFRCGATGSSRRHGEDAGRPCCLFQ